MFFSGKCLHLPPILLAALALHEKAACPLMLLSGSYFHQPPILLAALALHEEAVCSLMFFSCKCCISLQFSWQLLSCMKKLPFL
jgi:hypothetical protein